MRLWISSDLDPIARFRPGIEAAEQGVHPFGISPPLHCGLCHTGTGVFRRSSSIEDQYFVGRQRTKPGLDL